MAQIDFPSRVGIWWTSDSWAIGDAQQVARDVEALGYGSLFYGEAYGKETLTQAGAFLAATERLVVGTGIANIHARDPTAAESGALVGMGSVQEAAASVTAHLEAGADHVLVQVLGEGPFDDPRPALRELAPALGL